MKSILIVTQQFTVGGLETHIRGEIEQLSAMGIDVHLATGSLLDKTLLPPALKSLTSGLALEPAASAQQGWAAIEQIRRLIREHGIDRVHIHPFVSIIAAATAAELELVPYAVTLHGPDSLGSFYGPTFDVLLKDVVLPNCGAVIAVSPEVRGLAAAYVHEDDLHYIPNAVSFRPQSQADGTPNTGPWLAVSRLDDAKAPGIFDFCVKAKDSGLPHVLIAGDGPARPALESWLQQRGLGDFVSFLGNSAEVSHLMAGASGIAGMGRVLLEGVAARKPVVLVGYNGVKGVLDQVLFQSASLANFSGRGLATIDSETFQQQLASMQAYGEVEKLHAWARKGFEESVVWTTFAERIAAAKPPQRSLLTGLHLCLQESPPNEDAPYLNTLGFLSRLETVSRQKQYQQQPASAISLLELHLQQAMHKQLVAERDSHIAELQQRLSELQQDINDSETRISQLQRLVSTYQREMQNLHHSASWRVTHPLRLSYAAVSRWGTPLFMRLPMRWRQTVLNKVNPSAHPAASITSSPANNDLSWKAFSQKVLSRRDQYKGIFVQEPAIGWNVPLYQRPQHMAAAMARQGYLVIYRITDEMEDGVHGYREVEKNVWVTNGDEVDTIDNVIRSLYSTAQLISVKDILKNGARGKIIYEYIDHIDPEISGNESIKGLMALKNFAFSGGADYVVASAQKLYDEAIAAVGTDKTIMVQNGVDIRHYRDPRHKTQVLPASLTNFKKRFKHIVGYFGALAPWLWYETIAHLVSQKSDIGFVFIGPDYYGGIDKLPKADNVIYLGAVDYKTLPAYGMSFDVCFIPFKPGDIAKTTSPLKLFEYFALEKPVVVTSDMAECVRYPEVFHGASAQELSVAIDNAINTKDDKAFKKRLAELADLNSWDMRAASLVAGLKN